MQDLAPDCAEIPIGCRWRRRRDEVSALHQVLVRHSVKVIYLYEKKRGKTASQAGAYWFGWLQKPTLVTTSTIAEHRNRAHRVLIVRVFICAFPGFGAEQSKKNEQQEKLCKFCMTAITAAAGLAERELAVLPDILGSV